MEISALVLGYERRKSELERNLSRILIEDNPETRQAVEITCELCDKLNELGLGLRYVDDLERINQEACEVWALALHLDNGYKKIVNVCKDNLESFYAGFLENQDFVLSLPLIRSKIIEDIREELKKQREELENMVEETWKKEVDINKQGISIGKGMKAVVEYLKTLKIWHKTEKKLEEEIEMCFENAICMKIDTKILQDKSLLKVKKTEVTRFAEKVNNIEVFIQFLSSFFFRTREMDTKLEKVIEKVVKEQAVICVGNKKLQEESISISKKLLIFLNEMNFPVPRDYVDILHNCQETSALITKSMTLKQLKRFLEGPIINEIRTNKQTISENCDSYLYILQKTINNIETSEYALVQNLYTVREGSILYQALRPMQATDSFYTILIYCADLDHFANELIKISDSVQNIPTHLHYLTDFQDIIALINKQKKEALIDVTYECIREIKEKTAFIDFKDFKGKFSEQESSLKKTLDWIRTHQIKQVLSKKVYQKIFGLIIDELISDTSNKIMELKDIYENEIFNLKKFFNRIFQIRDVFEGERPVDFCKNWIRLESLLKIIEGRLKDIVGAYERREYQGLFTIDELRKLIEMLFEDNENRRKALKAIV
ncbi:hypothetical protein SteCoe_21931 [Stentor coeruleus]|uniref:ZW10 C-terminal helical domain-containing protein n=1 Tax=Stentor coeruleus TaxID=5963 RepID=A0A1R2BNG4_9CILI|nr:hypothetical protein SteCoe_21931 [Stentor coeruleus]